MSVLPSGAKAFTFTFRAAAPLLSSLSSSFSSSASSSSSWDSSSASATSSPDIQPTPTTSSSPFTFGATATTEPSPATMSDSSSAASTPSDDSESSVELNQEETYEQAAQRYLQHFKHGSSDANGEREDLINSPLMIGYAMRKLSDHRRAGSIFRQTDVFRQYAVQGMLTSEDVHADVPAMDRLLFLNTNAPWSTFICGSQGSGKSHTLCCLLENCLKPTPALGKLPAPLSGLVFHYDVGGGGGGGESGGGGGGGGGGICEAAYLASAGIPVKVLVSPWNYTALKKAYEAIPGVAGAGTLTVERLQFQSHHLNAKRLKQLMACDESDGAPPLYVELIGSILRRMVREKEDQGLAYAFSYREFRRRLDGERFSPAQLGPLAQRLAILEGFLDPREVPAALDAAAVGKKKPKKKKKENKLSKTQPSTDLPADPTLATPPSDLTIPDLTDPTSATPPSPPTTPDLTDATFATPPSHLTILDLTDPFVDPGTACGLFEMCLDLFLQAHSPGSSSSPTSHASGDGGVVIACDEAHKYLASPTSAGASFTAALLRTVSLQRHLNARVAISTQEPTLDPRLLDLSSSTWVHRFSSPQWAGVLERHLAGAAAVAAGEREGLGEGLMRRVVKLRVGEALVFAPGLLRDVDGLGRPERLGTGCVRVKVRGRLSGDGGRSVMAVRER